ncbi:MAG: Gfo/Idh/MocA family oxidoreductase, partial [Chitinophagaceae bacterium]|nr:Gfo/Idh/MocA family oxidoreductase [Chitinophagaceae bacterium]
MPYRFAIIGCGSIASRHAQHISSHGKLVGVTDIDISKATALAAAYEAKVYKDATGLFKNERPDVTVICSPNGLHANHAAQALLSGSHVLCEKPLVISSDDGKQLIGTASATGKKLFVVKQNRFNPPVILVKQLIDDGKLGKITGFNINCSWNRPDAYYKNTWRGTVDMDGGTLYTQFSHFIDILYWFIGDIKEATGWRANFMHQDTIQFEDTGVVSLVMNSGAIGTINYTINAVGGNMEGSFTVFGEKGTIKIGGQYLNTIDYFSVENENMPDITSGN